MRQNEKPFSQMKAEGTHSYYIRGMYLYGATWDEKQQALMDNSKHQAIGSHLPILHLVIERQGELEKNKNSAASDEG